MAPVEREIWIAWIRAWVVDLFEILILGATAGVGIGLGVVLLIWTVVTVAGVR